MFASDKLSDERVAELKAEYGPIFKTDIEGRPYYFRTLTRREAVELNLIDGYVEPEIEEAIFQKTLVHPNLIVDFDSIPAGVPSRVAQEVLERSGLAGAKWLNEYLERSRSSVTSYHTIAATICSAFDALLPGQLDDLNITQLMDLLVIAEEILSIRSKVGIGLYVPLSFEDALTDAEQLTDADRDAMVRMMLSQGMEDVPSGWIDKTKKRPPGARDIPNPTEDI